ncbi:MAG: rhomboid family intramembrane serine protease [Candidatus Dormibacteria bacterium]
MTENSWSDEGGLPHQPPALARLVGLGLVTRYRLRLADPRDSRLGELGSDYALVAVAWTGARSALVGFFQPPDDPAAQLADLHRRIGAALRWGDARLRTQPAARCDILLVALAPLTAQLPPPAHPAVHLGVVWADPGSGDGGALLPPPSGMPGVGEIRAAARALRDGAEPPTLAAVDLAERETVHSGYVAPARRALISTPRLTYGMVATFIVIFLIENTMWQRYGGPGDISGSGYLAVGGIAFGYPGGGDWWRFLSTAFLHVPGFFSSGGGASSYLSIHLLVNCYSTVVLGRIVEPMYGRITMIATFIATAFAASAVSVLASTLGLPFSDSIFVGASGGLMGLLGLLFSLGRVQGREVPAGLAHALRRGVMLSLIMTVVLGFTFSGYIDNYAHLGGFATGALIGLVIPPVRSVGGRDLALWQKAVLIGVIALGAAAMLLAVINFGQFLASNPLPLPTIAPIR